ncbi:hypothetical protein GCM10011578_096120 [Streptomyces fuscichromogenes]|uniref:Uncharacterized protein n=1 Tax=Streptomyces fuscichromogenes TaxID=1324013 RepID=A0A918CXC2_9ACTN|nr:hypothetical protein GCM10011578_096120 [Streptomyces fuscichromogenes]
MAAHSPVAALIAGLSAAALSVAVSLIDRTEQVPDRAGRQPLGRQLLVRAAVTLVQLVPRATSLALAETSWATSDMWIGRNIHGDVAHFGDMAMIPPSSFRSLNVT